MVKSCSRSGEKRDQPSFLASRKIYAPVCSFWGQQRIIRIILLKLGLPGPDFRGIPILEDIQVGR